MNLTPVFGVLFMIAFFVLLFWIPSEILRKAGFARGWAVLVVLTGYLGLIIFALAEWPIHRELAWYRLRAGDASEETTAAVERYAVDLEKCGEWKKAAEVFEELGRRAPSADASNYYANCLKRLHEKMGAEVA